MSCQNSRPDPLAFDYFGFEIRFAFVVSLDMILLALFLWIIFLSAILSIQDTASLSCSLIFCGSFPSREEWTFLMTVFMVERAARLLTLLFSDCLILLMADSCVANVFSPL